jgi:hypothetical protein
MSLVASSRIDIGKRTSVATSDCCRVPDFMSNADFRGVTGIGERFGGFQFSAMVDVLQEPAEAIQVNSHDVARFPRRAILSA